MGMADYVDPTIAAVAQHIARLQQYRQPAQAPAAPVMPQQAPQVPPSFMSQLLGAAQPLMPEIPALQDPNMAGSPQQMRGALTGRGPYGADTSWMWRLKREF